MIKKEILSQLACAHDAYARHKADSAEARQKLIAVLRICRKELADEEGGEIERIIALFEQGDGWQLISASWALASVIATASGTASAGPAMTISR